MFDHNKVSLTNCVAAIYVVATDKCGTSTFETDRRAVVCHTADAAKVHGYNG